MKIHLAFLSSGINILFNSTDYTQCGIKNSNVTVIKDEVTCEKCKNTRRYKYRWEGFAVEAEKKALRELNKKSE